MSIQSQPIGSAFFDPTDQTRFAWLGSAGLVINTRGTIIMIDPLLSLVVQDGHALSECGHRFTIELPIVAHDVPKLDAVLYTHADGDHFGIPTAMGLEARLTPQFFAPPIIKPKLDTIGVPINRITAAREGQSITVGPATIEITPAMHDWQPVDPFRREDCCGYVVRTPDGTIWHPGDSRLIDELLTVRDVDVLMFDVAQVKTHLGPAGSAELAKTCGATDLIAYHYGTYDVPPGGPFGCDPADCKPYLSDVPGRWRQPAPGQVLPLPLV